MSNRHTYTRSVPHWSHERAACPCRNGHDMVRLPETDNGYAEPIGPCRRCGIAVGENVRLAPGGAPNAYEISPCPGCRP